MRITRRIPMDIILLRPASAVILGISEVISRTARGMISAMADATIAKNISRKNVPRYGL